MMSNARTFSRTRFAVKAFVTLGIVSACARSHRSEAPGTAAPTASTSELAAPSYAEPPPAAESLDEAQKEERKPQGPVTTRDSQQAPAGAAVSRSSKAAEHAQPAAPSRAPAADMLPSPTKKKADGEGANLLAGPDDLGADPLLPTMKDSTNLRVALQDWRNAADQLAASHGCEDGCRALQSMQRAATRICNLVLNQDPAQRCAAAKSRLEDAQKDLTQRCGKCER